MDMRKWRWPLLRQSDRASFSDKQLCALSGLFDSDWYLARNPNVAASAMDPLEHYMRSGALEGRDPNPLFDSNWYRNANPDVAASGMNPLCHYLRSGAMQGRDPNPLFDSDWYLERNPDVAAAGINPLVHYVRWGAAKRLDPSPLFSTDWYLERNPDVAAAGINPLAHYIHWGAAELREPTSPIPQFFQKLTIKPKACGAELERLLDVYSSPPTIAPELARADNNNQVGVTWAEQFMFKSVETYKDGDLQAALRFSKYAVQTLPHEDDPILLYVNIFQRCNRSAIDAFARTYSGAGLLVIHVSHQSGICRAEQSCRSFADSSAVIGNLIVVADEALPENFFSFDGNRCILSVPAKDSYEALPQKVAKALLFLGLCDLDLPIVKVDDDARCEDLSRLKGLIKGALSQHLYGGRVNPRTSPATCSFWHFGKCTDQQINSRPDGLIWTAPYAGGQGYWMSAKAVSAMAKICLIHERHFEIESFEDRAVGTALVHYGVRPFHYDLVAAGVLSDTTQPPGMAKNPRVYLRGSPPNAKM
jgi:hypothetical protein